MLAINLQGPCAASHVSAGANTPQFVCITFRFRRVVFLFWDNVSSSQALKISLAPSGTALA